tara:strand:+ start:96 stop:314 length:219 start_codon:yes stop_codon:yes gene_type:complete
LISSFDILVYSYLKEEMINTPDSSEVKYLKQEFLELVNFVEYMDSLTFIAPEDPVSTINIFAKYLCPFFKES